MRPAALLWAWLCPAVATLVRMMMVRMLVRLLSLLAGRPLLSRRRAAVLGEGGDRRHQDDAGKTHTKKCANHAAIRSHMRPLYANRPNAVPGVRRRNWPASLRRNACEPPPKTIKEFKERAGVEHVDPLAQKLFVSDLSRDADSDGDAYFFKIDRGVTADGKS